MKYTQLTLQERYYIEIEMKNGTLQNKIAKALNRSQGTISKELARNRGNRGYRHKQANSIIISSLIWYNPPIHHQDS